MGSIMSYIKFVDVEIPEGKSMTSMTSKKDGPSLMSVVGYLQKSMETLSRGVSDHHDGCAGQTVDGMTVRRKCPSEVT